MSSGSEHGRHALPRGGTGSQAGASRGANWRATSPANRRLLVLGLCLVLAAAVALGLMVWQLRADALSDASRSVRSLGVAIAEQTSRSMQTGELALEDVRGTVEALMPRTPSDLAAQLGTESVFRSLKDRADLLPQVTAFAIVSTEGTLVNDSRAWPPRPADLPEFGDLAFFRTRADVDVAISAPVRDPMTGRSVALLGRRITAPSGEFVGLVMATLDLDSYQAFFRAVTDSAGVTVALLRTDGLVLTGALAVSAATGGQPGGARWLGLAEQGRQAAPSVPDDRLVSVHPIPGRSVAVTVSVARQDVLAHWSRIGLVLLACSLVAAACLALLIRAHLVQFGRLERSERLLAQRNAALNRSEQMLRAQADELSAGRALLAEQSSTLQAALRHMNQGILMVGADGRVVVCNECAVRMLDLPAELVASGPYFDDLIAYQKTTGEFVDPSSSIRAGSFARAVTGPVVYERIRPNGMVLEVQTVVMEDGGLVRTYTDVTERRRSERQAQFLAHHDMLTGLSNRNAFHERFAAFIAAREGRGFAVHYMDLDGFKLVNDTFGHVVGDQLLAAVASRLRAAVRDQDLVARMGGDEFSVIQPILGAATAVAELAGRLVASIAQPFQLGPVRCSVGLSIGVALYPEHAIDATELLHHADTALYRAKAGGKGAFCMFDPAVDDRRQPGASSRARARLPGADLVSRSAPAMAPDVAPDMAQDLAQELVQALDRGEFHLDYQPIVEAETLRVIRFEALLRWTHPRRGPILPATFIPVAEQCGAVAAIGAWVLETACTAATAWPGGIELSVNLSPMQLAGGGLAHQVEQVLLRTGLAPRLLNLELAEPVLADHGAPVLAAMNRLRPLGVRFSLDNFGSAQAALSSVLQFPFDVLKIDRSFVQASHDVRGRSVLKAIRDVGASGALQVVAEGIETDAELAAAREAGCDLVQGWLIARPSPVASLGGIGGAPARPARLTLVPREEAG